MLLGGVQVSELARVVAMAFSDSGRDVFSIDALVKTFGAMLPLEALMAGLNTFDNTNTIMLMDDVVFPI